MQSSIEQLVDAQELGNALLKKAAVSSQQLARDVERMKSLGEDMKDMASEQLYYKRNEYYSK